jgi:hypothetical protein
MVSSATASNLENFYMSLGEHVPGISCKHEWHPNAGGKKNETAYVCGHQKDSFSIVTALNVNGSTGCGAFAVFDERNKIVEYDRTYNWGRGTKVV